MERNSDMTQCQKPEKNGSRNSTFNENAEGSTIFDIPPINYRGIIMYGVPPEKDSDFHERMIASGFPRTLADLTFDDLMIDDCNRAQIQTAREFAETFPQHTNGCMYICGEFGTGKTWLAAAIGNAVARQYYRVRYGTFSGITEELISAQKSGDYTEKWHCYAKRAELLIIDDVGKEKPSGWKLQTLFRLIDERGNENLSTIFTSNYGPATLSERISTDKDDGITAGAIKDRLKRFSPLLLDGESRR